MNAPVTYMRHLGFEKRALCGTRSIGMEPITRWSSCHCWRMSIVGKSCLLVALATLFAVRGVSAQSAPDTGWPNYGNDAGGERFSPARQIDRGNVAQLQVAWTYRTGAYQQKTDLIQKAAFEATRIRIEARLMLTS